MTEVAILSEREVRKWEWDPQADGHSKAEQTLRQGDLTTAGAAAGGRGDTSQSYTTRSPVLEGGEGKALCVLPLGATLSTHSEYCKTVSCRGNRNRTILK